METQCSRARWLAVAGGESGLALRASGIGRGEHGGTGRTAAAAAGAAGTRTAAAGMAAAAGTRRARSAADAAMPDDASTPRRHRRRRRWAARHARAQPRTMPDARSAKPLSPPATASHLAPKRFPRPTPPVFRAPRQRPANAPARLSAPVFRAPQRFSAPDVPPAQRFSAGVVCAPERLSALFATQRTARFPTQPTTQPTTQRSPDSQRDCS